MAKTMRLRSIYRYILRANQDPESMARGVGLGLFIGMLPSFGIQIILAVAVAGLVNANRIVAAAGTLITNPFTMLPLTLFSVWIGDVILPGAPLVQTQDLSWEVLFKDSRLLQAYLLGCLTLSFIFGAFGYIGALSYLKWRQHISKGSEVA